ncbi:MAG: hypothetical protein ACLRTQ_11820 [Candidatus Borkfalkia sp.]
MQVDDEHGGDHYDEDERRHARSGRGNGAVAHRVIDVVLMVSNVGL